MNVSDGPTLGQQRVYKFLIACVIVGTIISIVGNQVAMIMLR